MAQLAIKGHPTKGSKVIEILRSLGGINALNCAGLDKDGFYYIGAQGIISHCSIPHNSVVFTIEEFLEKFPYKVGDKVLYLYCKAHIKSMKWDGIEIMYTVECNKKLWETSVFYLRSYKEENLTIQDIRDNNAEWLLNKLREMPAEGTLRTISYLYDELHKPQYPKTYEECRKMFGISKDMSIEWQHPILGYEIRLLADLQKLLICRDAYWKIAGEQIRLGKPWKPDWETSQVKFTIVECANEVVKTSDMCNKRILAFPTEEMRDAFYDNFKKLIEQCKELL